MTIKLIALDLDGTTLNSRKELTPGNRQALCEAIDRGVFVVIATGRVQSALPENVTELPGIQYAITSNGASVVDLRTGRPIYKNCIDPEAVEYMISVLRQYDFMMEVFVGGHAYVEQRIYDNIREEGFTALHTQYILETREPLAGLLDFALAHRDSIENVNVNFRNQADRSRMREVLAELPHLTLTTSFDHNLELGGETTSKADALSHLCDLLGVRREEIMACGDSPNDGAMLLAAGLPVAMGNGKEEIKAMAKYVTGTNDEDGVAQAVRKFVLK